MGLWPQLFYCVTGEKSENPAPPDPHNFCGHKTGGGEYSRYIEYTENTQNPLPEEGETPPEGNSPGGGGEGKGRCPVGVRRGHPVCSVCSVYSVYSKYSERSMCPLWGIQWS